MRTLYFYFVLFLLLLSSFFSSPKLSGCKLHVYHTSTHGVALVQFRMQVWNVLHAARWKCRTEKIAICAPSCNFVRLYLRNEGMYQQSEKNLLNSNISFTWSQQYCELRPTSGWDRLASMGHPSKFQRVSHLGFITAATSLTAGQPNFVRCLAVFWAGTVYTVSHKKGANLFWFMAKWLLFS